MFAKFMYSSKALEQGPVRRVIIACHDGVELRKAMSSLIE
jgi:hypothetical protein